MRPLVIEGHCDSLLNLLYMAYKYHLANLFICHMNFDTLKRTSEQNFNSDSIKHAFSVILQF